MLADLERCSHDHPTACIRGDTDQDSPTTESCRLLDGSRRRSAQACAGAAQADLGRIGHRLDARTIDDGHHDLRIQEADDGFGEFLRLRQQAQTSQLEQVGRQLRQMMPWLESERKVPPT